MTTSPYRYDLKTGYPNMDLVPRQRLAEIMAELLTQDRPPQYVGDMRGDSWTREQVAALLTQTSNHSISADEIMVTPGAISGTDQVCRYVTRPGDIVLVENPTFYYIIHKLELSHVTVEGVPMQSDGVDLDALEATLQRHNGRVKLFYTIPAFHNPTGACMSLEKRQRLVELAHQYDFSICEDATYQWLYFDAPPPPMIRTLDPDSGRVFTVGTFAKTIMPALRIGWLWATPKQVEALVAFQATATSTFMSRVVGTMIDTGEIYAQLDHSRKLHGDKHNLMVQTLRDHAPDWLDFPTPNGGYFIWATLPPQHAATAVLRIANQREIDFAEGMRAFVRSEAPDQFMRLCFALLPDADVAEGTRRLCEVLCELGGITV